MGKWGLVGLTWKAPLRLTFFSAVAEPESMSLSSSFLTFAAVFFFGRLFFFTTGFLFTPFLVGRARLFSSAWSFAAKAASSSTNFSTFLFFFGDGSLGAEDRSSSSLSRFVLILGGGEADTLIASSGDSEGSLLTTEVWPLVWRAEFFSAMNLSNRTMMSALISACD